MLAPLSLGLIEGNSNQSPLATSTVSIAIPSTFNANAIPLELAGTSVTVAGRAAPLFFVSPSQVRFYTPVGVTPGQAEVIVNSQGSTVYRGTVTISPFPSGLFTEKNPGGTGVSLIFGIFGTTSDTFDVFNPQNLGTDMRTRVTLFTTGLTAQPSLNTDTSNDVVSPNSPTLANFAESVTVEARTAGGRTSSLPVEFAGATSPVPGVDQVTFVLDPELRGAGAVEITIIVGGQRIKAGTINVR